MTWRFAFLAVFIQILCGYAFAQAPPPIPPIADTDRIQTYNITSSTAQVQVGFPIFGDCSDLTVTIAGVTLPPATVGPWNCASASGQPLTALPLPITDMVVNFNPPLTSGSVTIAGAWHPRNLTVPTASGINRREYEQAVSTLIASQRELFYELNNFLLASAPQGSLLYRGAGGWAAMPQGSVGTALISQGPGQLPGWQGISGLNGGTVTNIMTGAGLIGGPCIVICTISVPLEVAHTVKSNITGSAATAADNTVDAILDSRFGSTPGTMLYRGASVWTTIPQGIFGQVLAETGSPANPVPAWASPSRVLLNSMTAGGSGNLTDTTSITSAYTSYEIVLQNLIPVVNGTTCAIILSSNGVFQTANYKTAVSVQHTTSAGTGTTATTYIPCSDASTASTSPPGISASIKISNPVDTTMPKMISANLSLTEAIGSPVAITESGYWSGGNGVIDGVRVYFFPSSNILSGTMKIYGMN